MLGAIISAILVGNNAKSKGQTWGWGFAGFALYFILLFVSKILLLASGMQVNSQSEAAGISFVVMVVLVFATCAICASFIKPKPEALPENASIQISWQKEETIESQEFLKSNEALQFLKDNPDRIFKVEISGVSEVEFETLRSAFPKSSPRVVVVRKEEAPEPIATVDPQVDAA